MEMDFAEQQHSSGFYSTYISSTYWYHVMLKNLTGVLQISNMLQNCNYCWMF